MKQIAGNHTTPHSTESKLRMSQARKGKYIEEQNHNWKGDEVGYNALHVWVKSRLVSLGYCWECNTKTEKLDLANISGEYTRNILNWAYLCKKCHYKFDKLGEKRWKGHIKNSKKKCLKCDGSVKARGLCNKHHLRELREKWRILIYA